MKDSEAMGRLASLASKGQVGKVGSSIIEEARKHSARAAQWQIDQAASAAGAGKGSKQVLAAVLAAKELFNNSDPATGITKDAFDQRASTIAASPAFSKLSQRYDQDPAYRSRMDSEIAAGDKSNAVFWTTKRTNMLRRQRNPRSQWLPEQAGAYKVSRLNDMNEKNGEESIPSVLCASSFLRYCSSFNG